MNFSLVEIRFLQKLHKDGPGFRSAGVTARKFSMDYRIGMLQGSQVDYTKDDAELAAKLLLSRGLPLEFPIPGAVNRAARSELSGVSEKSGSISPHKGEVAIRALTKGCLWSGEPVPAFLPGYHVMRIDEALQIEADAILVVENLETLQQLHKYKWLHACAFAQKRVLCIYRGEKRFSCADSLEYLKASTLPVWSFPDFDPAGLGFSLGYPRLQGLALPWSHLEEATRKRNLGSLYHDQLPQWGTKLDADMTPDVRVAWTLLKRLRMGLNQEAMQNMA